MNNEKITIVKCFDARCPLWSNDRKHNKAVVDMILNNCFDFFRARGYLFLNEVYKELGMPLTKIGQIAGWISDTKHRNDVMWTVWCKYDGYDDVCITFEVLSNILEVLSIEEDIRENEEA